MCDSEAAVRARSEFDALIHGQGRRFRLGVRARTALCRLLHQPGWSHGALTVAYAFGAPAAAVSRRPPDVLRHTATPT